MKTMLKILGVLLLLGGGIWFLQGINLLPGSFMTGDPQWAINGAVAMALGAALFLANAYALYRRRADARAAAERTVARRRAGSPVRGYARDESARDLTQAPVARSIAYLIVGFVVMIWAIASLTS